jgi:DNA end-binding protein Ku
MHTVWKGAISFGLVHVPVKMFAAVEDRDIAMRMIHRECGGPIAYVRTCRNCGKEVANEEIAKGYEYEKGRFVLFEKDELDALAEETSKTIRILDFVDMREIDPIYFQRSYYLAPDQAGAGAYGLLLEAMKRTGRIGIASVAIRSKGSLAAVRFIDNCLVLETIAWPDEVRPVAQVPGLPERTAVNEKELEMATMLIDHLTGPFEPEKYRDEYRERLMEAIQAKIAGEEVHIAPERERTNVIDLMAALQASLEAAGAAKAGPAASADKGAARAAGTGSTGTGAAKAGSAAEAAKGAARAAGTGSTGAGAAKAGSAAGAAKGAARAAGTGSTGAGAAKAGPAASADMGAARTAGTGSTGAGAAKAGPAASVDKGAARAAGSAATKPGSAATAGTGAPLAAAAPDGGAGNSGR